MMTYYQEADLPPRYLLDFYSQSCQPCMRMMQILPKWSEDAQTEVVKVEVEEFPALALAYGIRRVPTFVYIEGGEERGRLVGVPRLLDLTELVGAD